jgi:hypothetical protein
MSVSGRPLTTQITYLRALRDLMEDCGDIPENLSANRIKFHLSVLQKKLSSSALNLCVSSLLSKWRDAASRDIAADSCATKWQ